MDKNKNKNINVINQIDSLTQALDNPTHEELHDYYEHVSLVLKEREMALLDLHKARKECSNSDRFIAFKNIMKAEELESTLDEGNRHSLEHLKLYRKWAEKSPDFVNDDEIRKYDELLYDAEQELQETLFEMEEAIVSHCYNGNIQNYAAFGKKLKQGRNFSYPITYNTFEGSTLKHDRSNSVNSDAYFETGRYVFGANQLFIMKALRKICEWKHLDRNLLTFDN